MYNIQERIDNFKLSFDEDPEIDYLKNCEIVDVINRALADLYLSQPNKPITYLANWLFSESEGNQMKILIDKENKKKQKITDEHNKIIEEDNKIKALEDEKNNLQLKERMDFIDEIKKYENFDMNLNLICDKLCYFVNSTGAYFSKYDNKRKTVKITDDENAHLMNNKVLRYIGYSHDHDFLYGKNLEVNVGVTYDFFDPKKKINTIRLERYPEEVDKESKIVRCKESANSRNSRKSRLKRLKESAKEQPFMLNYLLIDEIVYEKRMHYFREPRLGCYLALEIVVNSSLSTSSLNSAVTNFISYSKKRKEYEDRLAEIQRKKEAEEELERERLREMEEENNETTTQKDQKETSKDQKDTSKDQKDVSKDKKDQSKDQIKDKKDAKENKDKTKDNISNKEKSKEIEKSINDSKKEKERIDSTLNENKENNLTNQTKENLNTNDVNKTEAMDGNIEPLEDILDQTVILEDYDTNPKKIYLSLDTLGQDRVFTEEELKYIFDVVKSIKYSWEDLENSLLLKDRDIRITQMDNETIFKTKEYLADLAAKEEEYLREFFDLEENAAKLGEPGFRQNQTEILKNRFIAKNLQEDEKMLINFNLISEYEVRFFK